MRYYLFEDTKDNWAVLNRDRVLGLEAAQLARITGSSHLLVEARRLHGADLQPGHPLLKNTLDWLSNTYGFDGSLASKWFGLITRIKDYQQFWSDALNLFFQEIAAAISADIHDEAVANSWRGLALMADFAQCNYANDNKSEWEATCEEHFGHYLRG